MNKERALVGVQAGGLNSPVIVLTGYLVAIAGAEAITAFLGLVPGMIGHGILLVLIFSHYLLLSPATSLDDQRPAAAEPLRQALPVLSLFPLMRVLSLSLPLQSIPEIYWNVLVGVPMLVAVALTARLLGWSPSAIGFTTRSWPAQLLIALSGIPLSLAVYAVTSTSAPAVRGSSMIIGAIILIVFGGFLEEVLFRGLLQRVATETFGRWGIVASGGLFAAMYLGTLSAPEVGLMGLIGLFFGWCVDRTGAIWGVILAHGLILAGMFYVLPYGIIK